MPTLLIKRYKNPYQQLLFSKTVFTLIGFLFCVALPAALQYGLRPLSSLDSGQTTSLIGCSLAYLFTVMFIKHKIFRYPGGRSYVIAITQIISIYLVAFFTLLFLYIGTSRAVFLLSGAFSLVFFLAYLMLKNRYYPLRLGIIQKGFAEELVNTKAAAQLIPIDDLGQSTARYDAVTADFSCLNDAEEKFLTSCALNGTPVYNAKPVYESLTGRVKIDHISENNIGAMLPSPGLELFKRLSDSLLIILTAPLHLPIVIITAILIKLESKGPVFYTQTRIGKGNQPFQIYKLRSMSSKPNQGEQFAGANDARITKVGRFIRKWRIDEIPQFYNILKGDMSLIGPRPEQPGFVEDFSGKLPYYSYRHIVKPGITGWAQVRHGYADDEDSTAIKVEHDFYYIKHCSISLDIYIIFLTIRTMLTGFGAR
ncbi:sugar transferase [Alcaligenes endophyticus]|uniref:Sugar transferase n=1 Tax=Alcaligenes endophyticus TaxID=1929088 RepID=A0ABT8EG16_9BURK|nr:sugar transferase [Alcaligenes endophyticus]MCX5590200.1 sugar transferase [Alcaligenes endophyticus]MDN4120137.1 sugar transferase [Alcaligenes endophyticus]